MSARNVVGICELLDQELRFIFHHISLLHSQNFDFVSIPERILKLEIFSEE